MKKTSDYKDIHRFDSKMTESLLYQLPRASARASRSSLPKLPERKALGNLGRLRAVAVRRWRRLTMLNRRSLSDSRSNTQLGPAYYG